MAPCLGLGEIGCPFNVHRPRCFEAIQTGTCHLQSIPKLRDACDEFLHIALSGSSNGLFRPDRATKRVKDQRYCRKRQRCACGKHSIVTLWFHVTPGFGTELWSGWLAPGNYCSFTPDPLTLSLPLFWSFHLLVTLSILVALKSPSLRKALALYALRG